MSVRCDYALIPPLSSALLILRRRTANSLLVRGSHIQGTVNVNRSCQPPTSYQTGKPLVTQDRRSYTDETYESFVYFQFLFYIRHRHCIIRHLNFNVFCKPQRDRRSQRSRDQNSPFLSLGWGWGL